MLTFLPSHSRNCEHGRILQTDRERVYARRNADDQRGDTAWGRLVLDHYPEPLEQMAEGLFGFPGNPERWRFDCVVDGKALRLNYSGNDFYRFFTGDE